MIGRGSVVNGGVFVTASVPPGSVVSGPNGWTMHGCGGAEVDRDGRRVIRGRIPGSPGGTSCGDPRRCVEAGRDGR